MATKSYNNLGPRNVMGGGFAFRKTTKTGPNVSFKVLMGQITAANVRSTTAGTGLAHANGVILVPAAPAGYIHKLEWCVVALDYGGTAHTAATGNLTVNIGGGGAALTGLVAESVFVAAAADKIVEFVPLAATINTYTTANPLNLVATVTPTGTGNSPINWAIGYYVIGPVVV